MIQLTRVAYAAFLVFILAGGRASPANASGEAGQECVRSGDCALMATCHEGTCTADHGSVPFGGPCRIDAECGARTKCDVGKGRCLRVFASEFSQIYAGRHGAAVTPRLLVEETEIRGAVLRCASIEAKDARGACYDRIASPAEKPRKTTTPRGKWKVDETTSKWDDQVEVVASLKADGEIQGWLHRSRPMLVARCKERRLSVYVVLGLPPDLEFGKESTNTARVRFDQGEPREIEMGISTSGETLFFEDAEESVKEIIGAQRLVFGFTPFKGSPQTMEFRLDGSMGALEPVLRRCGYFE